MTKGINWSKTKNKLYTFSQFVRHNVRIVFGSRFIYFLIFSVSLFLIIMLIMLLDNSNPTEADFYFVLIIPAVTLILYPSAFGVQSDKDIRILEVLFGVPDYRYKVWLIRLLISLFISFGIVFALTAITHYLLFDVRIMKMSTQIMFPVLFSATLAFMLSTVFKSGTGAAVVLVVILLVFFVFQDFFSEKAWNLYLNPFESSQTGSEITWQNMILKNRAYLTVLSLLFLVYGLFNLQKREGFLK